MSSQTWITILSSTLALALVTAGAYLRSPERTAPAPILSPPNSNAAVALTPAQQLWQHMNEAEKNGRYDEALETNRTIHAQYGDLYLVNLRAGWLHYLKQDYSAAIDSYRRAATLAPGAAAPLHGLGACHVALGQSEQAIPVALALLVLDPMNYAANRRLADLYYQTRHYAQAEVYYLKLCTLYPEDLDVAVQLAWCEYQQRRTVEARTLFNAVLIAAPGHASALQGLSACDSLPLSD